MKNRKPERTRKKAKGQRRLIVVSNRLPVVLKKNANKRWQVESGSGGLVSAMLPVLRNRGGTWIGWTGTTAEQGSTYKRVLSSASQAAGYDLVPIVLSAEEYEKYYHGYSNEILWPLFHDMPGSANFDPDYWPVYQAVNRRFAETIAANSQAGDFIWIHDYQLMLVAAFLKALGVTNKISFFLHIPFPSLDIFLRMPRRYELLQALMQYDLIGFQTLRDRRNFLQCVRSMMGSAEVAGKGPVLDVRVDLRPIASGPDTDKVLQRRRGAARAFRVGAFPISIDTAAYERLATREDTAERSEWLRASMHGRKMMLSVSRLDYTKGIPQMLKAFQDALRRHPDLRGKLTLVTVVVPSRREVPAYNNLRIEIEQLVGEINGELSEAGWIPLHYLYRSLPAEELVAYYHAADIAIITPLKDGMNLVAKEYCAAHTGEDGVLILSEFAGAAAQMQHNALMVNPHDIRGMADTIYQAVKLPKAERSRRQKRLRRNLRSKDIFEWVDSFLDAAIASDIDAFPRLEDFVPKPATELLGGDVPALPL